MTRILEFDRVAFGKTIRMMRRKQGLSQRRLQAETDVNYATISNIERGAYKFSQNAVLLALWADIDLRDYVNVNQRGEQK